MRVVLDAIVNVFFIAVAYLSMSRDSLVPIVTVILTIAMMVVYNLLSRATRVKVIKVSKEENNND